MGREQSQREGERAPRTAPQDAPTGAALGRASRGPIALKAQNITPMFAQEGGQETYQLPKDPTECFLRAAKLPSAFIFNLELVHVQCKSIKVLITFPSGSLQ